MARSLFVFLALGVSSALAACVLSRSGTEADTGSPAPADGGGGQDATTTTTTGGGGSGGDPSGPTTTTTGGGGQGGNGVESNCVNGVDDDGDQATDCDDSDCSGAGYTCLAPSPGATGYLVFGGSCPAETAPKALRTCDAGGCSCTAQNGTCTVTVNRWDGNDCNGNPNATITDDFNCKNPSNGDSSFMGSATVLGNGNCNASPDVPSTDPGACEVQGGSCPNGGACVGPSFPMQAVCVTMPGNATCAAPYDGWRAVMYDSAAATCACDCSKSSESCDGFWAWVGIHNATETCSDVQVDYAPLDNQCWVVGMTTSYQIYPVPALVTCGAPGAVIAGSEVTVCCTQQPQ